MNDIRENLAHLYAEITKHKKDWNRFGDDICLIAVSKTHPVSSIEAAIEAGQKHFGENKVQEAAAKFPALKRLHPDIRLHLIGPLQSNKVKDAVRMGDYIHSVDREKLALLLAEEMKKQKKTVPLFLQVNIGEESQKAGISLQQIDGFIDFCRGLGLPIIGLMCIPPMEENPSPYFALLQKIAKRKELRFLSMGMSGDFPQAIALGATHLRIGSRIFGARSPILNA